MIIPIEQLKNNKLNSNLMSDDTKLKLIENIKQQEGKYPPIIVRKINENPTQFDIDNTEGEVVGYRIVDGHNRKSAIEFLGYKEANCEIWDIDDKTEMLLLATMNELKGTQDLSKRAFLLHTIELAGVDRENLLKLIPEDNSRLEFLLSVVAESDLNNITDDVLRDNAKIEIERNSLVERFVNEGFSIEKAKAMADIHSYKKYVPDNDIKMEGKKFGNRPLMIFWFNSQEDYEKCCIFFETDGIKEPRTEKLISLVLRENMPVEKKDEQVGRK